MKTNWVNWYWCCIAARIFLLCCLGVDLYLICTMERRHLLIAYAVAAGLIVVDYLLDQLLIGIEQQLWLRNSAEIIKQKHKK